MWNIQDAYWKRPMVWCPDRSRGCEVCGGQGVATAYHRDRVTARRALERYGRWDPSRVDIGEGLVHGGCSIHHSGPPSLAFCGFDEPVTDDEVNCPGCLAVEAAGCGCDVGWCCT